MTVIRLSTAGDLKMLYWGNYGIYLGSVAVILKKSHADGNFEGESEALGTDFAQNRSGFPYGNQLCWETINNTPLYD